jgi:hypothetical protein
MAAKIPNLLSSTQEAIDPPAELSARKQTRLERRFTEAVEAVKAGEHRLRYGPPPVAKKRRGAL